MSVGFALSGWVIGANEPVLCPEPALRTPVTGELKLSAQTIIVYAPGALGAEAAAGFLAERWRESSGLPLPVKAGDKAQGNSTILFAASGMDDSSIAPEGYSLQAKPDGVVIKAQDAAGYFYAVQTLLQLAQGKERSIPCLDINDAPRFGWRGLMLDESRHFMGKASVCKILDSMAALKLNRFHWHLTDAPGWRLEIKRFPPLTTISATGDNSDPARPPQFYTQAEVREILAYARVRHIMVIPEIEMPAHSTAAMRAYPNLSCTGKPEFPYCPGNDETIRFLEQVLDETVDLFDSPFIHIGGDECPKELWKTCPKCQARKTANGLKDEHELQSWMIRHFDQYLAKKGRRLIGWDEILEGGLAPGAAVMSWRGLEGGQSAAAMGHDVVMTPQSYLYLDYPQTAAPDSYTYYPVRVNSCERILSFNPVEGIPPEQQKHILGLQGNLWSETVFNGKEAEWKLFPRAAAIAELAWVPAGKASWSHFQTRIPAITAWLKSKGLNVAPVAEPVWYQPVGGWKTKELSETWTPHEWIVTNNLHGAETYKARFIYTDGRHQLQVRNAVLLDNGQKIAEDTRQGAAGAGGRMFDFNLALPSPAKAGAVYTLQAEVRTDGGNDSIGTICVFPAKLVP